MLERRPEKRSEKFLVFLIVIAVLISLVGTFFSLRMVNELEVYKQYFTGYGTSGQINITISQNLSINVIQTNISFGTGFVDTDTTGAILNSSVANYTAEPTNWSNTSLYNPKPLQLRNEGNVNASVNLTSGSDAAGFIGGTGPVYEFNGSNIETASGTSCVETGILSDYTSLDTTQQEVCTNLGSNDNRDELYVHCRIFVPYDTTGEKEDFWTFIAAAVT